MLPSALYSQLAQATAFNDPVTAALVANTMPVVSQAQDSSQSTTPTGSRDTMFTKIFVGGLPYHTTDLTLHEYFKQFGDIEEAVVITDRQTQKSRGYGFVTMKERADAEKACKDPNPIIDGRKANVNLAFLGAKPRNNVNLTSLTTGLTTLPLQQQLAALMPGRMGLPQLYYPNASAAQNAGNGLLSQLTAAQMNPQLAAALQFQQLQAVSQAVQAQAIQQQPQNAQAAAAAALSAQQQQMGGGAGANNYLNYATLHAALAAQQSPNAADFAALQQQMAAVANQSAANSLVYRKAKEDKAKFSPY